MQHTCCCEETITADRWDVCLVLGGGGACAALCSAEPRNLSLEFLLSAPQPPPHASSCLALPSPFFCCMSVTTHKPHCTQHTLASCISPPVARGQPADSVAMPTAGCVCVCRMPRPAQRRPHRHAMLHAPPARFSPHLSTGDCAPRSPPHAAACKCGSWCRVRGAGCICTAAWRRCRSR